MELDTIVCGDFLDIASTVADSSVHLIVSDWPYYKVKAIDWDRQWKTAEEYLDWIGLVCEYYRRILAPNGSLYAFASKQMAWAVEGKIREWFNVVNSITWKKGEFDTKAEMFPKDTLRSYFPISEVIILAEHYGADNTAKGESGYGAKCDELRGFVFEPLRAYLDGERRRAGFIGNEADHKIRDALGVSLKGGGLCSHFWGRSQWQLPTVKHYSILQNLFNQQGRNPAPPYEDYHDAPRTRFERDHDEREYLRAEYEYLRAEYEDLRAEYEDLRAEYEDLRRPFSMTPQDQYTDVWEFPTVKAYPGKHPCEKPPEMWEHIIKVSSREGDVVGDFFCGSGGSLEMAHKMCRHYIGCDLLPKWAKRANERVEKARLEMAQLRMEV